MGLITGAGVPKSSLGLVPVDWLSTFWSDPIDRIRALARVLRHYALLSGCISRWSETEWDELPTMNVECSSNFIKRDEIILYNKLVKQLELNYIYMHRAVGLTNPNSHTTSGPALGSGSNVSYEVEICQLLRQVQLRALNGAHQLDDMSMAIGALLMWAVTLFIWYHIAGYLLSPLSFSYVAYSKRYDSATAKSVELFSLRSAKLLSTVATVLLILQTISLGGSSFAEEEHQFWYYFSTSLLILSAGLIGLSCPNWTLKRTALRNLFALLLLDRVLLRRLHQTGSKWIHLEDLSDWLIRPEHSFWLWLSQIVGWLTLMLHRAVAVRRSLESRHLIQSFFSSPVASLALISIGQLSYRLAVALSQSDWSVIAARLVYCLLAVDCVILSYWRRHNQFTTSLQVSKSASPDWSQISFDVLHPIGTLPLLFCLLGRSSVSLLWTGVILKEFWLASVMQLLWDRSKWSEAKPSRWHAACCWLLYWIQGWTTYFQQGNSISLSTVDVSAAYVGLRTHQPLISGLLLACYTYAGPLYWQLAYLVRYAVRSPTATTTVNISTGNKNCFISSALFRLGYVILPLTFCATVCFILQSHLFIWTVFTPKLLYLATFQVLFVPVLILWACKTD
ncbi:GPI ethanolamine phosphate transferase 2 [Fasciola gigantica]|uniref:GPI ethanolamine phosphate transferase 2 n=1 Tax=Fasciola gigantica TaxID=46835 RepID=A0A504Y685_FASGI|nr:GPI ethanolamine phosphate transferase 2 [Fasciola gigantica]